MLFWVVIGLIIAIGAALVGYGIYRLDRDQDKGVGVFFIAFGSVIAAIAVGFAAAAVLEMPHSR